MAWKREPTFSDGRVLQHKAGKVGRNCTIDNAITIEKHYSYNGSADVGAFGGAKKWPTLTLNWEFQEGEETLRDVTVRKLKEFIDELYEEKENKIDKNK